MAILKASRFRNLQNCNEPQDKSRYKNINKLSSATWKTGILFDNLAGEGDIGLYYVVLEGEFTKAGVTHNVVDAPEPPFNSGDSLA